MKIYSFPPIEPTEPKVLILGTMPGKKSLELNQYYGHGGNHFWKILFCLFNEEFSTDYLSRIKLAQLNQIAIWDVLKACVRESNADSDIELEEANDFESFLKSHHTIQAIFFNGKNAAEFYSEHVKTNHLPQFILPSTSPANTWFTFDEKLKEWAQILNYLK